MPTGVRLNNDVFRQRNSRGNLSFFRGDSNGDRKVNLSDALYTLDYLFSSTETPSCMDAADANDDGRVDIADPINTLLVLFDGQRSLPPPYPESGRDPTGDALVCVPAS